MNENVVILGAGLAGLGCARALPGARVFEAESDPGGMARSHTCDGKVWFDRGCHICHSKDTAWLDLLKVADPSVVATARSRVVNYWHGHWITYPVQNHLLELPAENRIRALADLVSAQIEHKGRIPANYLEWCRFHYGEYLTWNFYEEYTRKYWRTPMEELATDWLSGRLLPSQIEKVIAGAMAEQPEDQPAFASFYYPSRGGYFSLFAPLYENVKVVCGARAAELEPKKKTVTFSDGRQESYEYLASSVPLPKLVQMIKDAPVEVRRAADALKHQRLLCVNMVIARENLTPNHWFYIYDNDVEASRVSFPGNLAPGSVPAGHTAMQAEIFRRPDETMDAASLAERTVRDMSRLLKFEAADMASVHVQEVPYTYIISNHHRAAAVQAVHDWLRGLGIIPMGMYGEWKFLWSDAAFRSGEQTALAIRGQMQ